MRQHEAELATKAELLLRREADFARKAALQLIAFLQREGALVAKESAQRKEAQRLDALWERMNQDARRRGVDIMANEEQRRRAVSLDEESTRGCVLHRMAQSELAADEAASRLDIEGTRDRELRRTERSMATEGKLAAAVSHVVATEASSRVTVRAAWWSAMYTLARAERLHRVEAGEAATRRRICELEANEQTARWHIRRASERDMENLTSSAATHRAAAALTATRKRIAQTSAAMRVAEVERDEAPARRGIEAAWQRKIEEMKQLENLSWSDAVATLRRRRDAQAAVRQQRAAELAALKQREVDRAAKRHYGVEHPAKAAYQSAAQAVHIQAACSYAPAYYYAPTCDYYADPAPATKLDWNEFQAAHRGEGYTRGSGPNSFSRAYAQYKKSR
jgi:hypothetical protein